MRSESGQANRIAVAVTRVLVLVTVAVGGVAGGARFVTPILQNRPLTIIESLDSRGEVGSIDGGDPAADQEPEEPPGSSSMASMPFPEWNLSTLPNLILGVADGDPEELFHNVSGAVQLMDGRIAVVDAGRSVVTFFDGEGRHLRTLGRAGDGPEEFRSPRLLSAASYDSLVVFGVSRISIVRLDGTIVVAGSHAPPDLPRAVTPAGLIYQRFPHMGMAERSGPRPTDPELLLVDLHVGSRRTLANYQYETDYVVLSEWGRLTLPLPLRAGLSVAPESGGGVAVVVANEGVLRMIRPSTGSESSYPLPMTPAEVTASDVEQILADRLESANTRNPDLAQVIGDLPFPETFPFVEALVSDEAGGVWARLHPEHARRLGGNWLALSTSGEGRALIQVPDPLELTQVGPDFIIGIARDELGVQRVERYDLDRRSD